ncbi:hypothetical protein CHCC20375_1624 [Bacillus licheniformis]|nr:hypothetical protein CHCC20375_1624 [Bacillus licheniformis]
MSVRQFQSAEASFHHFHPLRKLYIKYGFLFIMFQKIQST